MACAPTTALKADATSGNLDPARAGLVSASSLTKVAARPSPSGWRLLPDSLEPEFDDLLPNGVRRVMNEGMRALDLPDGSVRMARLGFQNVGIKALDLPERLGGGVLFSGDAPSGTSLWWAKDWLADPEGIASLSDRIESISIGFDRLYLRTTGNHDELLALDLHGKRLTDLAPLPPSSAYGPMLFVDEWFGAVYTEVMGLQATFDGGASWHALGISSNELVLRERDGDVVITTQREEIALGRDGRLHSSSLEQTRTAAPAHDDDATFALKGSPSDRSYALPLGARPLREAVLYGWPENAKEAVVASHGALARVRLDDGKILNLEAKAYDGDAPCPAVGLGDGFGFVCSERGLGTRIYAFVPPLGLASVGYFRTQRHVTTSGNGHLVIEGACNAGARASDADPSDFGAQPTRPAKPSAARYCIIDAAQRQREVLIPNSDADQRVVALADGRIAVVHPPTRALAARLRLLNGDSVTEKTLTLKLPDAKLRKLLTQGSWMDGLTEVEPNVLGGWVAGTSYVGIHLDMDGQVETPTAADQEYGDLERTVLNGPFGFEISASGVAWQTSNYGFRWRKLNAPRSLDPYYSTDPRAKNGPAPALGCSAVGCVYEPWVRLGYEGDDAGVAVPQVEIPNALSGASARYEDWRLNCYPTAQRRSIDATFRRELGQLENTPAKHGAETGYSSLASHSPTPQAISSGAFRPFLGVQSPAHTAQGWRFDMGHDRPGEFRAYAWGGRGSLWRENATWLVRVATRFGPKPFWSTAPTRAPWSEWVAAQAFGADTSSQSASDWMLFLDPDENSGLLRVASQRNFAELHWLEDGHAINSVGGGELGRPSSVVRTDNGLMLGVNESMRFRIYRLSQRELQEVATLPLPFETRAQLVRSSDATRLAVWINSARGEWYFYPLTREFAPDAPFVVKRDELSHTAKTCSPDAQGWLVRATPPLNRSQADDLDLVTLALPGARANQLEAKVLATPEGVCLLELAANLVSTKHDATSSTEVPTSATIPLSVRDYESGDQLRFRCESASGATRTK
jgi:hypothetical protein